MASYEVNGWPRETILAVIKNPSAEQFCPECKVYCDWASRYTEAERLGDMEYPYAPGCGAFPVYIYIEPNGKMNTAPGATMASYEHACITIRYSTCRSTSEAIVEWIEPYAHRESAAGRGLVNGSGISIHRNDMPPLQRSGCVFHHIRYKLPVVPGNILTIGDCVNSNQIFCPTLNMWFAAGTLLSTVPYISRTWTTSGLTPYIVHQQFIYKYGGGYGWNSVFDSGTGTYSPSYNSSGTRIYQHPLATFTLA
jgi:hypothetical protein